jgi:predicted enzyme related to lactoylglutathione lyase
MENLKNAINWFEIPVVDFERARLFYSKIYDFEMPAIQMGADQLGFFPVQPGHIGGAIIKSEGQLPSVQGSLIYLNGGDDLSIICDRIEEAGGKVIQAKTPISPENGYYALFHDTEGNRVALHSMK